MRAFLDFEASSLARRSYPIEVGWVFEEGAGERHLIRPAPDWTDWDPKAERLHGLSRAELEAEGEPHDQVARRVLEALSGHAVYVSAPSWDGHWLSVLLRAAGLPRHALRLKDADDACREAARDALGPAPTDEDIERLVERARALLAAEPPSHRALQDAERERSIWRQVRRLAAEQGG